MFQLPSELTNVVIATPDKRFLLYKAKDTYTKWSFTLEIPGTSNKVVSNHIYSVLGLNLPDEIPIRNNLMEIEVVPEIVCVSGKIKMILVKLLSGVSLQTDKEAVIRPLSWSQFMKAITPEFAFINWARNNNNSAFTSSAVFTAREFFERGMLR